MIINIPQAFHRIPYPLYTPLSTYRRHQETSPLHFSHIVTIVWIYSVRISLISAFLSMRPCPLRQWRKAGEWRRDAISCPIALSVCCFCPGESKNANLINVNRTWVFFSHFCFLLSTRSWTETFTCFARVYNDVSGWTSDWAVIVVAMSCHATDGHSPGSPALDGWTFLSPTIYSPLVGVEYCRDDDDGQISSGGCYFVAALFVQCLSVVMVLMLRDMLNS